ncbi:SusC/RagA family TonB-linked outer membrane protein [Arachidicoccus soli]|uniref:TonB-dependent receptor n=1 Tax=Arachidicoccus soli TaxID=2341117 RepID=A0A386HMR4_9BACT|nr:TonB-dependent receptor [Arachidicoccus soli]AYD47085.1 TonB-dependent receptor [Arachidicoccus soli]
MINKKFYKFFSLIFFVLLSYFSYAQTRIISGDVKDENGQPLALVSVTEVGGTKTTLTNDKGDFSISISDDAKFLQFSYLGKKNVIKLIVNGQLIHVQMEAVASALNDVVVIGYGTQKRGDVNGSISSISAKDIANIPQVSVDQMMQGKAAGVTITQNSGAPGSATSVHIRGITSFSGTEPLYVIDGVEMSGNASAQLTSPGSSQQETSFSPLAMLNPNDIESIDILKDASATAIYGSRGANGVVIITTKQGKVGNTVLSYDAYVGDQQQGKFLDMMNLQQYATLQNSLATTFGETTRGDFENPSALGPGTNWQKAIFQNALMTSHSISASGSNGKSNYYVSGGYLDQDGTILGFNFKRYTFRANINSQVKSWLKIGANIGANRSNQNTGLGDNTGIIYDALLAAPDQPIYNADGSFSGPQVSSTGQVEGGVNPIQQAKNITNNLIRNEVNGNMFADINFIKDLYLHSEVSGDFNWGDNYTFRPTYSYGMTGTPTNTWQTNSQATLQRRLNNSVYWSWKEYLNYDHTWGKSNISAIVGHEVWYSNWDQLGLTGNGFVAGNTLKSIALATVQGYSSPAEINNTTTMESYLARAIYTYDNKYSITASMRNDKSSNFAPGHNVGHFPGVAVSWKLSNERFMNNIKGVVDNLKIRLGYGTTGNSNVPTYAYGSSLSAVATNAGTGFVIYNVANPNLKWETAIQSDAGLDFGLLNERISGSFDYYIKTSKNFIFQKPLPAFLLGGANDYGDHTASIAPPYFNAGNIRNQGFEFTINSKNIVGKNFQWNTSLTFSHYNNKVVSLDGAPQINQSLALAFITYSNITKTIVGKPIGEFYGYKVKGIINSQADLQYLAQHPQNVTGSPQIVTSDRTNGSHIWLGDIEYQGNNDGAPNTQYALGSPNPDFTYGLTNTFDYKNLELSIFVYGSHGGKIFNALRAETEGLSGLYQNQLAAAADFWTPQNTSAKVPAPYGGLGNPNLIMSDRWLEDASFLRFQNVRLGYTLPDAIAHHIAMKGLKVYISAQNLFVITKYSGLDPEVGSRNQDPTLQNIDLGRYPSPRVFTFGINAQF